jgi:hypothetical protein
MPLISYLCSCKRVLSKFYRWRNDSPSSIVCECGGEFKRQLSAPSNKSVLTIDNGVMAKSVEVNLETIKSNEENSTKDFREKP